MEEYRPTNTKPNERVEEGLFEILLPLYCFYVITLRSSLLRVTTPEKT